MLRQFVIWGSFALTVGCAVMAKVARWGDPAFFFLALGAVFLVVFLFAVQTPSGKTERGPSLFRVGRLWLANKEKDLQARLDQSPKP